ncbi:MAG: phenylacetate--CoA ligase family protein [Alphaproteobacteria bacterium]|nr:phenylacetate--CoA ligase family protein [Alphaproteobacteria bacterium]
MDQGYDGLETRTTEARQKDLEERLVTLLRHAQSLPFWAERLGPPLGAGNHTGQDAPRALAQVPVTPAAVLRQAQAARPPWGGLLAMEPDRLRRVHLHRGLTLAEGWQPDPWRFARGLWAAGLRLDGLALSLLSWQAGPGAAMVDTGAAAIGAAVLHAGPGRRASALTAIRSLRPAVIIATPDQMADLAPELGPQRWALVGAAVPAALRHLGHAVHSLYATAELGLIGYETTAPARLVLEEHILVELLDATNQPVPPGTLGRVVVTSLDIDQPLLRLDTGDLARWALGPNPCGRTNRALAQPIVKAATVG